MDATVLESAPTADEAERLSAIVAYYSEIGEAYAHWSPAMNMHFGYWRWPASPLMREPMLEALSALVHARLSLAVDAHGAVLDLGCGVGSSARQLARSHAGVSVIALTLTPAQIEECDRLTVAAGLGGRVETLCADYRAIPRPSASAIGAYAIESACYDPQHGAGLIGEAARVLAPGARLVVADAFRCGPLPRLAERCEARMAAGWVLPSLCSLPRFAAALAEHGFELERCEDISWRVLPSIAHIPLVAASYRLTRGRLDAHQRGHLSASLWCLVLALLWPRRFGYYVVTARRL